MSGTPSLRWEWTLANGARIAAELEVSSSPRELVFVGSRLVSEADRGRRPMGHTVAAQSQPGARVDEPIEAVLVFEPSAPICVLRVEGFEVAPTLWPVPQRRTSPPGARPLPRWALLAVAAVVIVGAGVAFLVRSSGSPNGEELSGSHRAANGLFIAHYPPVLKIRPVVLPAPLGGILLEDDAAREALILAAFPLDGSSAPDRWVVHQRFHDEVLANLPKTARTYVPLDRREEKCLNEPGAVVVGRFDRPDGQHARVWSCAFVKEGRGYFVLYALPESSADARLRRIVEGTELTQLASLGAPP